VRADIIPGGTFPDYELTDHTKARRRLSELQGIDPMILVPPIRQGHARRKQGLLLVDLWLTCD
jgi:hypothetical protein